MGELFWLELPPRSADAFSESIDDIGGGHDPELNFSMCGLSGS
jgi:hypothetical protein